MALETDTYPSLPYRPLPSPPTHLHSLTHNTFGLLGISDDGQGCLRQGSAQITSLYRLLARAVKRRGRATQQEGLIANPSLITHRQTQTGGSSLEQQAVSFFLRLLSSKLFHLCQRGDRGNFNGRSSLARVRRWFSVSRQGESRAGPRAGLRPVSYTPTFGLAAARLLLLQPPWCSHYVTAGSPLLLLSHQSCVHRSLPIWGLLVLTTPACSCHSHYPCCHYPC